ncbi:RNA-binding transcriptional accessory protein [Alkalibacter rhizosphaerae]|uniref:RNA-binding transcriptional accessory protein n=1 Tax=Alkalibacter rhizosphaerae TaxID=2815577 RepID=A0A974XE10_9FIRM|nr:Tex family protein [Alkalibacter rhizosphaerae]QSX08006.1 RNA-binding transcriptional accessory protein [Alkalibacter rhizosphaerae]
MKISITSRLAKEFNIKESQVETTVDLIDQGNTIPFIARYRKEATGNLDDVTLRDLHDRLGYLRNLEKRKEEVLRLIDEQGKLTEDLSKKITNAMVLQEVEDLYLPYRQKRKTRASVAREKGLEPLAAFLVVAENNGVVEKQAENFVNLELGVETAADAIQGAMDILAEDLSDDAGHRKRIREAYFSKGVIQVSKTKTKEEEAESFRMYFEFAESVSKIANHRVLAINRGEKKKFLQVKIEVPEEMLASDIAKRTGPKDRALCGYAMDAINDALKRLIFPSMEREVRNALTEVADKSAIKVFAVNLNKYLMQPPVKGKRVMGFDPAFRTGCKIALMDSFGELLAYDTIYPTQPQNKVKEAKERLVSLIEKYKMDIIAIGNGTASRESEVIVAEMIREYGLKTEYIVVNEAGASVYSASVIGNEEFPQLNVSIRGAVSIGRRLQDPLAELVKIDPKHIGVGQYQHDVDQKELAKALDGVIEDAVNAVGVDLNTASAYLLARISGLNKTTAGNIVQYRRENGPFTNRKQLMKVPKIGAKAFEQCAGFLRISGGDDPFDNTALHPESYESATALLASMGLSRKDLEKNHQATVEALEKVDVPQKAKELEIGVLTLTDIVKELQKPGRDPRDQFQKPVFKSEVMDITHLEPGMVLSGTVRNVIDFGVFVDIGVHQDGLVHISQLSDKYVKNPMDVVSVGDIVSVRVLDVDLKRNRISLTMKKQG